MLTRKMTTRFILVTLVTCGCMSPKVVPVYADASVLLSAQLDLPNPIAGRVSGFDVLVSSNPAVPGTSKQGPAGVTDLLVSPDRLSDIALFQTEADADTHFSEECRDMGEHLDGGSVQVKHVPDGGSCATPYVLSRNDAHGAWAALGYYGGVVVRRGVLVVKLWKESDSPPTDKTEPMTPILNRIASELGASDHRRP